MGSQWGDPSQQRSSEGNFQLSTFLRFAVAPCGRLRVAEVRAADGRVVREAGSEDPCRPGCCAPFV